MGLYPQISIWNNLVALLILIFQLTFVIFIRQYMVLNRPPMPGMQDFLSFFYNKGSQYVRLTLLCLLDMAQS